MFLDLLGRFGQKKVVDGLVSVSSGISELAIILHQRTTHGCESTVPPAV
jgi:hypothetical protein